MGCDLKNAIFNIFSLIGIEASSQDNALMRMLRDLTDDNVNIGSGNGLVPYGNMPMLIYIFVVIWRH